MKGQNTSKETLFLEFQNQRDMKSEVYESVFMFGQNIKFQFLT